VTFRISQFAVLAICGLASLVLIVRFWINRRRAIARKDDICTTALGVLRQKDICTTALGVLALGLIFYRVAWNLVTPAVLQVGMDFDEAQSVLARQHAKQAGFDALLPKAEREQKKLLYYWLVTGPAVKIIAKTTPTGHVIESLSFSTYAPKSWKSKTDPEHEKFFDSFVQVEEYDLKTSPIDRGGVQGDDRVPGGGREQAATLRLISNLVFSAILAVACLVGLVAGGRVDEKSIRSIRRFLLWAVALFALGLILLHCLERLGIEDGIVAIVALCAVLFLAYAVFALFVAVRLMFRAEHRRTSFPLACTALLPVFVVLVASVI
jgi:hypothetical protein